MKILIIGCSGFIGSNAYRYFKLHQYSVIGCDINKNTPNDFLLKSDLSNIHELLKDITFDACINASGSPTVAYSISNQQNDYVLNFENVVTLLDSIKKYQPACKFINLSSAAVYGNPKKLPVSESDFPNPLSPYGKHKLLSEDLLSSYFQKYEIPTLSLRIFSVYGNGLQKQLFWDIYQKSLKSNIIELFGSGTETRDFIHIDDLMEAFHLILNNASFNGSTINVASGIEVQVKQAAETMVNHYNKALQIKFSGVINKNDPAHWWADISKLNSLGFKPKTNIIEGLKKYALWLKELG